MNQNMVLIRQQEIRGTERHRRPNDEQKEAKDLNAQKDNEEVETQLTHMNMTPQGKQK